MTETKLTTRVIETTLTTGTGTLDLNGPVTGYRAFGDDLTSGDETWYLITDSASTPTVFEIGRGTFTAAEPNTLSRDAVLYSTNGNNKVILQPEVTYIVNGSPPADFIGRLSPISTQSITLDELSVAPATAGGQGALYAKSFAGEPELFYRAELDGPETRVTDHGRLVGSVPAGGIIMWSGAVASIPIGWFLCDGQNGTPDLRNRFVVGAGDTYGPGMSGGAATHSHTISGLNIDVTVNPHTLSQAQIPSHRHYDQEMPATGQGGGWSPAVMGAHPGTATQGLAGGGQAHSHTATATHLGGAVSSDANVPPYYALAYIMKA